MKSEIQGGRLWFLSLAAAMGGFLFGYDTAVINGGEQQIQSVWLLSSVMHGWVMSMALWGTVIGAMTGGKVCDRFGRKPTLFGIGVLYLLSAVWSAFAGGPYSLMAARFVGGVGVGVSSIAAPVYISEISPADSRGRLCALFQFNIVIGMVVSQIVNWVIGSAPLGDATWRWMLGAEAFPALAFTLLCPFLVESPRWLGMKEQGMGNRERGMGKGFFSRANLRPISLAFCVAMFNQLSGICAVLYFARRVFQLAGCSSETALAVTAWLTVLLGLGTFAGLFLIDRIGRRQMLILGGVGYLVSLFGCAAAFILGWNVVAAACIFLFIFSHAVGQGTVIWVFISEVFPQKFRAQGQSFGSFTHWMFCATLTFVFPLMTAKMPTWSIFAIFGTFMVFHIFWAIFVVPETKGKALEEINL
ncbi:MAG: MFS transporter [Kiritimatiellae bacterium]|nr:MFS transporter [Kiritimatiellia bacterium]